MILTVSLYSSRCHSLTIDCIDLKWFKKSGHIFKRVLPIYPYRHKLLIWHRPDLNDAENIVLDFDQSAVLNIGSNNAKSASDKIIVHSVTPNPFSENLAFRFSVEDEMRITITLVTTESKIVYSEVHQLASGANVVNIEGFEYLAAGILWYRITTADKQIISDQIIKVK